MNLNELKSGIPDYAKDLRLNLDSVLTETGAPGLTVYRTDQDGRVVIESNGRSLTVRTQR